MRREIKHNGGKYERRRAEEEMEAGETERERHSEQGRLMEQLRDEERAAGKGGGEKRGRDMVWQIKEEHGAAANCSPYDASLGLRAVDSAC